MRLVDRLDIRAQRGVVHLMIGELPDPFVLVMSPAFARSLIEEIQEAIGVAELENEERDADAPKEICSFDFGSYVCGLPMGHAGGCSKVCEQSRPANSSESPNGSTPTGSLKGGGA